MKNQKNIILTVVVLLFVVFGVWYLFTRSASNSSVVIGTNGSATTTATTTATTPTNTGAKKATKPAGAAQGNLSTVVAQGGNYTCTVDTLGVSSRTTGTVYGAGGKTRLDLTITANDGTIVMTHVIRSSATSYTWVDGQSTGIKAAITSTSPIVPIPSGGVITETDLANISSTCRPWLPDNAEFVPPSGITFRAQ